MSGVRYVHTNIVAKEWRGLVAFYIEVFGCRIVPPERDLAGRWLDELTGIQNAHIRGAHLALPGFSEGGPTLEIFSYSPEALAPEGSPINRRGLAHIAFHVDDVRAVVAKIKEHGGGLLGSIVEQRYDEIGTLTVAYCSDPEGNYIEVQHWAK